MSFVNMGISGVGEVQPGTHLCALYSGPTERDTLLYSFLNEGLRTGDKCMCLVADDDELSSVRDQLASAEAVPEQLHVGRTSDMYLRGGTFSVDRMISFLEDSLQSFAKQRDFALLRAAGEMSWVLPQPPGAEEFFAYESAVNRVVEEKPAVLMCMYDLSRFGVSAVVEVLKTHPRVLMDRAVLDNPHYQPNYQPHRQPTSTSRAPSTGAAGAGLALETLPAARRRPAPEDPWLSLTGAELRVTELVARGMSNREVAERLTVSRHTVDAHLKHIYAKLDIHSRVELTVRALQRRTLGS